MIYTTPQTHIFHGEKNMVSCRLSQHKNSIHGGFPIGFPLINHPFLGIPIYGNSHIMPHEYMAFCCLFFFPMFSTALLMVF